MTEGRLYITSREHFQNIFHFSLPFDLFQKFVIKFFENFHIHEIDSKEKQLKIIDIRKDCPRPKILVLSVFLEVVIKDNWLKEFTQFIEDFCKNENLPLQDDWNYLELNK